jgi:hypothetical protein
MAVSRKKQEENSTSPAVVVVNKKASSVMAGAMGTLIDFKNKAEVEKALKDIVKRHKKRISEIKELQVFTTPELEEAKKIRAELRDARYTLQNVGEANKKVLNAMKTNHVHTINELICIVEPAEIEINAKIKAEEDRKNFEKEEAERMERERVEAIEGRIADAGTEFDKLILEAKRTKNWDLFEAFYNSFEAGLDTLEEMAFEGQEVLEEATKKKAEAIAAAEEEERLAKQAEEQAAKDKELNERQNILEKQAANANEDKRRVKAMFSIGFMFNGEDFVKGESSYPEADILEATESTFNEIITFWEDAIKNEKEAAAEAEALAEAKYKAQDERKTKWEKLVIEAGELDLDIIHEVDPEEVEDFQVNDLEKRIANYKTEQGRIAEEARKEEARKEALEIKLYASGIFEIIEPSIEKLRTDLDPAWLSEGKVRSEAIIFISFVTEAYKQFKENTNQNITIE